MIENDESFLKENNISLRDGSIAINKQTFYTNQINSLRVEANIVGGKKFSTISLAICVLALTYFVIFNAALFLITVIPLGATAALNLVNIDKKSMYHLILTTSSGEVESFSSSNEDTVSRIEKLIDEHIKSCNIYRE